MLCIRVYPETTTKNLCPVSTGGQCNPYPSNSTGTAANKILMIANRNSRYLKHKTEFTSEIMKKKKKICEISRSGTSHFF